jgi:hypothetical protein
MLGRNLVRKGVADSRVGGARTVVGKVRISQRFPF